MILRRIAAAIALAAVLAAAGCSETRNRRIQGWVEAELIFVSPDEPGRIETSSVREGDQVAMRAPLFTLDADLQQADLRCRRRR